MFMNSRYMTQLTLNSTSATWCRQRLGMTHSLLLDVSNLTDLLWICYVKPMLFNTPLLCTPNESEYLLLPNISFTCFLCRHRVNMQILYYICHPTRLAKRKKILPTILPSLKAHVVNLVHSHSFSFCLLYKAPFFCVFALLIVHLKSGRPSGLYTTSISVLREKWVFSYINI